ncbi:MAG: signal transduction histidine kinase [Candidatus Poriferisodalaceae bacterium]|jgi:signal transduction histidine kinase
MGRRIGRKYENDQFVCLTPPTIVARTLMAVGTTESSPSASPTSGRRRFNQLAQRADQLLAGAPRPGRWTAAAVIVLAVLVVAEVALTRTRLPFLVGFAGLITVATIMIRRSHALLALGVAVAARAGTVLVPAIEGDERTVGTGAQFIATIVIGYSAARWIHRRYAILAISVIILTIALSWSLAGDHIGEAIGGLFGWTILAGVGIAMRVRADRAARNLDQVRLAERHDLARELHDVVAHHVSAIAVQADVAKALQATNPEATTAAIESIRSTATEALTEMRRMVGVLRDGQTAEPAALTESLRQLVATSPNEPHPTLSIDGDLSTVPSTIAAAVQRIVQESLTNARKYSRHASQVNVVLKRDALGVAISVANNGDTAVSGECTAGYGLVGMDGFPDDSRRPARHRGRRSHLAVSHRTTGRRLHLW